jgi:lipopolysaccharide/colanic/teichoic acid biosynthesis glycosyltransferase
MAPLFLFTAFAIYVEDRGPIFFVQKRVGKDGRVFDMYKFRSMSVDADAVRDRLQHLNESRDGVLFKIANDPRVTRVGRILRRLSIDETPQFFNVLRGEMSLVGPRPLPVRDVAKFTLAERRRLHVKPGLTCIWQVSGRSDIPIKQQVELDLQYIRSQSLWTDVRLLFRTVLAVVIGRGAY